MNLTERSQKVLEEALRTARQNSNPELLPSHVLLAICSLNEEIARRLFMAVEVPIATLEQEFRVINAQLPRAQGGSDPTSGSMFQNYLDDAERASTDLGDEFLSIEHFLIAGPRCKQVSVQKAFQKYKMDADAIKRSILGIRGKNRVVDTNPENKLAILEKYTRDLTELARSGKLDPVIGRDAEIRRVIQILSRRTKNNPVLIGEPGVGKTAIAEGLALRMIRGDVPDNLKNRKLLSLDIASLVAGAKFRGEFEERLKGVLKAVQDATGNIVLFIDEIHTIVRAGNAEGAVDAGNMLKPALARGDLRCVGATTLDEYRLIEKDRALERRFQPVLVAPPSVEDTITILRGLKERYEIHHGVRIKDNAIIAAATLSDRYIADRFLPDKAIDLIDEAASRLKIQLDSVPEALDTTLRKIGHLKMELAAISKERDEQNQQKIHDLNVEITALEAQAHRMQMEWDRAKLEVGEISALKKKIEECRLKYEEFERKSEYSKASEIKFGELPHLTKRLEELTQALSDKSAGSENLVLFKEEVAVEDIANVVSSWTGIPVNKLFSAERTRLLQLEDELRTRVVGQEAAIRAVANAVRLSRSGLKDPQRPIGSFLFLGPTGVGKTETAKTLAAVLFDSEKSMIRLDMSEYMEEHTVAKLIGSPPGYVGYEEGGYLTETVRRKAYTVVLFDEIEKAHPKVLNVLLQVLDDGRLTDSHGRTVDFRNTVIIMTSNIAAHEILDASHTGLPYVELRKLVMKEVLRYLRPELLNRIDETIVFNPLGADVVESIIRIQLRRLEERLKGQGFGLSVPDHVVKRIAKEGFDPSFGARPLKRALQEHLEVPLSVALLNGEFTEGDVIRVVEKDGILDFVTH